MNPAMAELKRTLGVWQAAAVSIGAIIGANLAGMIGLVLSSPVVATVRLVLGYVYRKTLDLDPWPEPAAPSPPRSTWPPPS